MRKRCAAAAAVGRGPVPAAAGQRVVRPAAVQPLVGHQLVVRLAVVCLAAERPGA
jgi:hypothetical protein